MIQSVGVNELSEKCLWCDGVNRVDGDDNQYLYGRFSISE